MLVSQFRILKNSPGWSRGNVARFAGLFVPGIPTTFVRQTQLIRFVEDQTCVTTPGQSGAALSHASAIRGPPVPARPTSPPGV